MGLQPIISESSGRRLLQNMECKTLLCDETSRVFLQSVPARGEGVRRGRLVVGE